MIPRSHRGGWALLAAVLVAVAARTSLAQDLTCGPQGVIAIQCSERNGALAGILGETPA